MFGDTVTDRDEPDLTAPRRALVLIDVQNEYSRLPLRIRYPRLRDCMEQIERVLDAAESAGLPVVCVQHAGPPGGTIFAPGGKGFELCPSIERRRTPQWKSVVKHHGSIYAGTDLAAWLHEQGVNTVTLVGFMANNCVLASAAWGETIGLTTEVLSDAVGDTLPPAGAIDAYGDRHTVPARVGCPCPDETAPRRAECPCRCPRQRGQQQRGSP